MRARLAARGVRLPDYEMLEQTDLIEAERQSLLIEFGKETVRILSAARDSAQANALIEHLKKIYFIGYEEQERRRIKEQAEELVRLSQLTFHVTPTKEGGILEFGKRKP